MATLQRILIVVVGIAGYTLATSLRQQGVNQELVERICVRPVGGPSITL